MGQGLLDVVAAAAVVRADPGRDLRRGREFGQDRVAAGNSAPGTRRNCPAAGLRRAGAGMMGVLVFAAIRLSPSLALGRTL